MIGRREFLGMTAAAGMAALLTKGATANASGQTFELAEATVADITAAMQTGRLTSRGLVEQYLANIKAIDGKLNSVIELNPDALAIADQMDKERKAGKIRGPLHGIPVL